MYLCKGEICQRHRLARSVHSKMWYFLQLFARSFVNSIEKNDANVKISESKSKN